eukprot:CAMPEP_0119205572 /NCGR_PEP_ID=MMETSP1316-20130426/39952_1 /TAXON_ID=41880 /ORGANISM="Pycnococcus provasolii, Strain RCC2336" /LENGTH=262 /DNA_ID=CAMNT_0007201961 /DNA_START=483 /DNA_END=1271 /DNA_ORIENTATION=-
MFSRPAHGDEAAAAPPPPPPTSSRTTTTYPAVTEVEMTPTVVPPPMQPAMTSAVTHPRMVGFPFWNGCEAPPRELQTPDGRTVRLNILFKHVTCCGEGGGVAESDAKRPPSSLAGRVDEAAWRDFMGRQLMDTVKLRTDGCGMCLLCFTGIVFTLGLGLLCCCEKWSKEVMEWDAALRDWQRRFNEQVLSPAGAMAKTQSNCVVTGSGRDRQRYIQRWIAIATTPETIASLQQEAHLYGDIQSGCCGIHWCDEHQFCVHPWG